MFLWDCGKPVYCVVLRLCVCVFADQNDQYFCILSLVPFGIYIS